MQSQDYGSVLVRRESAVQMNAIYFVLLLVSSVLLAALILSSVIRTYLWHKSRVDVKFKSFQLSLLGGRLFFRDFQYHDKDQTIFIHSGIITWHYWRWRVQDAAIITQRKLKKTAAHSGVEPTEALEGGGVGGVKKVPCRVTIAVDGLQMVAHSWSPSFDAIATHLGYTKDSDDSKNETDTSEQTAHTTGADVNKATLRQVKHLFESVNPMSKENMLDTDAALEKPDIPSILYLLPIQVTCSTGSIIIGNPNTPAVVVARFSSALGRIDAAEAGPLDVYRQIVQFDLQKPRIQILENEDYEETILHRGERTYKEAVGEQVRQSLERNVPASDVNQKIRLDPRAWIRKVLMPNDTWKSTVVHPDDQKSSSSVKSSKVQQRQNTRWKGLPRYYLPDDSNENEEWKDVEYARAEEILDSEKISLCFYWDIQGPVPSLSQMNEPPPAFGVDLALHGGRLNYGPWADSQRAKIQSAFFPAFYADTVPPPPLKPGDIRPYEQFKFTLIVESRSVVRVPFREQSKNFQYKGKSPQNTLDSKVIAPQVRKWTLRKQEKEDPEKGKRPCGWLDVSVAPGSTVAYTMGMLPSKDGTGNSLAVKILQCEAKSSINYSTVLKASEFVCNGSLPSPLKWNALKEWQFTIGLEDPEVFLLRDHVFWIVDMISDWTAGDPPQFHTFTPMKYYLDLLAPSFKIYLNTNEANIVNDSADIGDNDFICLEGKDLCTSLFLPSDTFRPVRGEMKFEVTASDLVGNLYLPVRNTIRAFSGNNTMLNIDLLTIRGCYASPFESTTQKTDRLDIDIEVGTATALLYGYLVRYILRLVDNYVGDFIHFCTTEEYVKGHRRPKEPQFDPALQPVRGSDLDVAASIVILDLKLAVPVNMFEADKNIAIDIPEIGIDLRINNYYFDMQLDVSPFGASLGSVEIKDSFLTNHTGEKEVFVNSINATAHRLFGLPNTEPTYAAYWDVCVGDITGELSPEFVHRASVVSNVLPFGLDDIENGTHLVTPTKAMDVTFLRCRIGAILLTLLADPHAVVLELDPLKLEFNDWAHRSYSDALTVVIPKVSVAAVSIEATKTGFSIKEVHAMITTSLTIEKADRAEDFQANLEKQQAHIALHDKRTKRVPFLRVPEARSTNAQTLAAVNFEIESPASQFPPVPAPAAKHADGFSLWSGRSKMSSVKLSSRSSFLNVDLLDASQRRKGKRAVSPSRSGFISVSSLTPSHSVKMSRKAKTAMFERPRNRVSKVKPRAGCMPPEYPGQYEPPTPKPVSRLSSRPRLRARKDVGTSSIDVALDSGVFGFVQPQLIDVMLSILKIVDIIDISQLMDWLHVKIVSETIKKPKSSDTTWTFPTVWTPILAVRALAPFEMKGMRDNPFDYVDLVVRDFRLAATVIGDDFVKAVNDKSAFRCLISDILVRIGTSQGAQEHLPHAVLKLSKLAVSVELSDPMSVHSRINQVHLETDPSRVVRTVEMAERTMALVGYIQSSLEKLENTSTIHHANSLVSLLAKGSKDIPKAAFLSQKDYHRNELFQSPRANDSWKLLMRIRTVLHALSYFVKLQLQTDVTDMLSRSQDTFVTAWELFVDNASTIQDPPYLIQLLEGMHRKPKPLEKARGLVPNLSVMVDSFLLEFDAPESETAIEISSLLVAVSERRKKKGSVPQINLNISADKLEMRVGWQMLDMVGPLSVMAGKDGFAKPLIEKESVPSDPFLFRSIHSVFSISTVSVSFHSPNVELSWRLQGLRASVCAVTDKTSNQFDDKTVSTFVATSSSSVVAIESRTSPVAKLYSDNIVINVANKDNSWNIVGKAARQRIEMEANLLGIVAVADQVLQEEVGQVLSIVQPMMKKKKADAVAVDVGEVDKAVAASSPFPIISFALLMDRFELVLPFMTTVRYVVNGNLARLSLHPKKTKDLHFDFKFDLGTYLHSVEVQDENKVFKSISTLHTPTVNGSLIFNELRSNFDECIIREVIANAVVDPILLDAAAMYHLLALFQKAEVMQTITTLEQNISVISNYASKLFNSGGPQVAPAGARSRRQSLSRSIKSMNPTSKWKLDIGLVFVQFVIQTSAPSSASKSDRALLDAGFNGASIHVLMEPSETSKLYPSFYFKIYSLFARMATRDAQGAVSQHGHIDTAIEAQSTVNMTHPVNPRRGFNVGFGHFHAILHTNAVAVAVDIIHYLGNRLESVDLSAEKKYIKRLRPLLKDAQNRVELHESLRSDDLSDTVIPYDIRISIHEIYLAWNPVPGSVADTEAMFSVELIKLTVQETISLGIWNVALRIPPYDDPATLSLPKGLAHLPEIYFSIKLKRLPDAYKIEFNGNGKPLQIDLDSKFVVYIMTLNKSMHEAALLFQTAIDSLSDPAEKTAPADADTEGTDSLSEPEVPQPSEESVPVKESVSLGLFKNRRLACFSGTVSFEGVMVGLWGSSEYWPHIAPGTTSLKSPGIALKADYWNMDPNQSASVICELLITASNNILYPHVMPHLLDILDSIKNVMQETPGAPIPPPAKTTSKGPHNQDEAATSQLSGFFGGSETSELLRRTKVSFSTRICQQEVTLSCHPYARVLSKASIDEIFITTNSLANSDLVAAVEHAFFSITAQIKSIRVSISHEFSTDDTLSFEIPSIVLSLMNSKHLSGVAGLSVALQVNEINLLARAKQLHNFNLFREVWGFDELTQAAIVPKQEVPTIPEPSKPKEHLAVKYQQMSSAPAFPVNAVAVVNKIMVQCGYGIAEVLELGIDNLWVSSHKTSSRSQSISIGIDRIGVLKLRTTDLKLRTGEAKLRAAEAEHQTADTNRQYVNLNGIKVQSIVTWKEIVGRDHPALQVQLDGRFDSLETEISHDSPIFAGQLSTFQVTVYNSKSSDPNEPDRLTCYIECDGLAAFLSTESAGQFVKLTDVFQKIIESNRESFKKELKALRKVHKWKDTSKVRSRSKSASPPEAKEELKQKEGADPEKDQEIFPLKNHTQVIVSIKGALVSVFPGNFSTRRMVRLKAQRFAANFLVGTSGEQLVAKLALQLGQINLEITTLTEPFSARLSNNSLTAAIKNASDATNSLMVLQIPGIKIDMQTGQPVLDDAKPDGPMPPDRARAPTEIRYIFENEVADDIDFTTNFDRFRQLWEMWGNHQDYLDSVLRMRASIRANRGFRATSRPDQPGLLGLPHPSRSLGPVRIGILASSVTSEVSTSGSVEDVAAVPEKPAGSVASAASAASAANPAIATAASPASPGPKERIIVDVQQSDRYTYVPVRDAIIIIPQLRKIGSAPPDWIFRREKLPIMVHQAVIVPLLKVSHQVEEVYDRIIGGKIVEAEG